MVKRLHTVFHGDIAAQSGIRFTRRVRQRFVRMSDVTMNDSVHTGTHAHNKSSTARMADAVQQVGQGLQLAVPRGVPHAYNDCYTVRLTYADNFRHDISQNGSASSYQAFRMSSIFDPDRTGTGHQAFMRDLWSSQYDYYSVVQCEYTIRMYNCSAESVTYTAVGTNAQRIGAVNVTFVRATTNTTDLTAPANGIIYPQAEMKNVVTDFLIPDEKLEYHDVLTQGDFRIDAKDADSDNTWVAIGANPTVDRIFGYIISPAQWTGLTGVSELPVSAIQVQVVLDYTVQFSQVNASLRTVSS